MTQSLLSDFRDEEISLSNEPKITEIQSKASEEIEIISVSHEPQEKPKDDEIEKIKVDRLRKLYDSYMKIARTGEGQKARFAILFTNSLREKINIMEGEGIR